MKLVGISEEEDLPSFQAGIDSRTDHGCFFEHSAPAEQEEVKE